ncbi:MAG: hypothetical protein WC205_15800 [Opitutaceae bacterium]|jgi:hypothetical protein
MVAEDYIGQHRATLGILVTDSELCDTLFSTGLTPQNKKLLSSISKECQLVRRDGIKWNQCLNYLGQRQAIVIDSNQVRTLRAGPKLAETVKSLPSANSAIAGLAIEVTKLLNKVRERHDLTPEQNTAMVRFKEVHRQAYELVS